MAASAARRAAMEALRAVGSRRADLPAALARTRAVLGDDRDRALAAEIATGILRWQGALDHLIAHAARRPVDELDSDVLIALRIGAYQLLHLERVPEWAAVNEAVELVRESGRTRATSLANAVLRSIARTRQAPPLPPRPTGLDTSQAEAAAAEVALDYLSITLSHPRWLARRWLARYGFAATEAWVRFNNAPAPMTLRVNALRIDAPMLVARLAAHGVEATPAAWSPDGLTVRTGNPLRTPLAGEGLFTVQDEASQLVSAMAGARPGERVLDACAAPGGKALAMAGAMRGTGLLVAGDFRPARVELLAATLSAGGARAAAVARFDLQRGLPFQAVFDGVLVDAPCSGVGTIRRDPDIRWRCRETDLARLAERQRAMLGQAASVVRVGGRLVYATCSSEPEENEEVVASFLAGRPDFERADPRAVYDSWPTRLSDLIDGAGQLRTLPHRDGLEAFFAVLLRRRW